MLGIFVNIPLCDVCKMSHFKENADCHITRENVYCDSIRESVCILSHCWQECLYFVTLLRRMSVHCHIVNANVCALSHC